MDWQLAEAKNRFSELINRALHEGPQRVRRRQEQVVVLAGEEYDRLVGRVADFKQYLMHGESLEGLDLTRDPSTGRDLPL
jgi:prevent-host-death family protein